MLSISTSILCDILKLPSSSPISHIIQQIQVLYKFRQNHKICSKQLQRIQSQILLTKIQMENTISTATQAKINHHIQEQNQRYQRAKQSHEFATNFLNQMERQIEGNEYKNLLCSVAYQQIILPTKYNIQEQSNQEPSDSQKEVEQLKKQLIKAKKEINQTRKAARQTYIDSLMD